MLIVPGSLRPSQNITTFGPGSIVQMANDSEILITYQIISSILFF